MMNQVGSSMPQVATGNTTLKLPDRFQLVVSGSECVLVSLSESIRVRGEQGAGELLKQLFPRLQRGCGMAELLDAIDVSNHELLARIIHDLSDRGLLREYPVRVDGNELTAEEKGTYIDQARFFSNFLPHFGAPSSAGPSELEDASVLAQRKLRRSRVMLLGLGRVGARLAEGLAHVGVGRVYGCDRAPVADEDTRDTSYSPQDLGRVREDILKDKIQSCNRFVEYAPLGRDDPFAGGAEAWPEVNLVVLCEDHFDPDFYGRVNRFCLKRRITWTSYRNTGLRFEVGPLIVPHETACFKCLELRKAANLNGYDDVLNVCRRLREQKSSLGSLNITLGYEILALEAVKMLSGFGRPATYASVFTFDLSTLEAKLHPVLKIPRCPECSKASLNRPTLNIWDRDQLL